MPTVLLLRAPASDGQLDAYETQFVSKGYLATSLPVLETFHANSEELRRIIRAGPSSEGFRGVIITSARACAAWHEAVQELSQYPVGDIGVSWSQLPFYAVGQSTADALKDIRTSYPSPMSPADIRGAAESGTSERLAKFIISDLPARQERAKLLYLTGDKNRDTLPNILSDGGVDLVSLKVYETRGSSTFAAALHSLLKSSPPEASDWWIVFFAPSAADFAVPVLRETFSLPEHNASSDRPHKPPAKLAAIGPTTADHLRGTWSLQVDVVSAKPGPSDLAKAIAEHDRLSNRLL